MKPNLIIIGAQKCGSSSLHHYLDQHPDISMSRIKELDFFVDELNWNKGPDWYAAQFDNGGVAVVGEASPSYTMYPNFTGVPARMHGFVPEARLIYIVRDPVERIVSHYLHQWYGKRQQATSLDSLADLEQPKSRHYLKTSSYYLQLSQYLEFYDISRILVLSLEELKNDRQATMRKAFRFLGVDENVEPDNKVGVVNATSAKMRTNRLGDLVLSGSPLASSLRSLAGSLLPAGAKQRARALLGSKYTDPELSPAVRETLKDALRDDIARFRELTGRPFAEWDV